MKKQKKQMRLYDIYKFIVDGRKDTIRNISSWNIYNDDLIVHFSNHTTVTWSILDYQDKKKAIKEVNRELSEIEKLRSNSKT